MTEKQQQLLFDKGITNVPSDALCSDNALSESVGMVYDNGEHRVIQKPKEKTSIYNIPGELVYIHQDRYIFKKKDGNDYYLVYRVDGQQSVPDPDDVCDLGAESNVKVTSIGKTLIVATPSGIKYVLWDNVYKVMGDSVPEISVEFSLSETEAEDVSYYNDRYVDIDGMINADQKVVFATNADPVSGYVAIHNWNQGKEEDAQNAIIGLVSKRLNKVKEDKKFAFLVKANQPGYPVDVVLNLLHDLGVADEIVIFGHSLNRIDMCYFKKFFECFSQTKQSITFVTKDESSKERLINNISRYAIPFELLAESGRVVFLLTDDFNSHYVSEDFKLFLGN